MRILSKKEKEILLLLFKDFTNQYNAHTISSKVNMSHRGALKALKNLEKNNTVISEQLGKAIFYKPNLKDDYTKKFISLLLLEESMEKERWIEEFKELYPFSKIVLIFGSILTRLKEAKDIDLMIISDAKGFKKIAKVLDKKSVVLPKKIQKIGMTLQSLKNNIKNKNPAIIDGIKKGLVLFGQEEFVEAISDVTNKE